MKQLARSHPTAWQQEGAFGLRAPPSLPFLATAAGGEPRHPPCPSVPRPPCRLSRTSQAVILPHVPCSRPSCRCICHCADCLRRTWRRPVPPNQRAGSYSSCPTAISLAVKPTCILFFFFLSWADGGNFGSASPSLNSHCYHQNRNETKQASKLSAPSLPVSLSPASSPGDALTLRSLILPPQSRFSSSWMVVFSPRSRWPSILSLMVTPGGGGEGGKRGERS